MNKVNTRKLSVILGLLAVAMFGFAFALVPLYEVFCQLTGLNGKTRGPAVTNEQPRVSEGKHSLQRVVTIQFLTRVSNGMPWEFRPLERQLKVRPGESYSTRFYVRNRSHQPVTGQAVPSVSPAAASLHLHKTECFCFSRQQLQAGEALEMPVTFLIDKDLPKEIRTLSLAYTLFRTDHE